MSQKTEFRLDPSLLIKKLNTIEKIAIKESIEKGIEISANMFLEKSDRGAAPLSPHLHGGLRGSRFVSKVLGSSSSFSIIFGYNVPYAAKWHDYKGKVKWSEINVGKKWLYTKMLLFRAKSREIITDKILEGLKKYRSGK